MTTPAPFSLIADIGGTNSRIALARDTQIDQDSVRRYANRELGGVGDLIARFLADHDISADLVGGVCVAAAGPVHDGVADLTNLKWRIDRAMLRRAVSAERAAVLNDLQAQGHALTHLPKDRVLEISPGKAEAAANPMAARLVVGIGTGFNIAPVFSTAGGRFVPPAEAGHIALPVFDEASAKVAAFLTAHAGFASVEEALSGRGLSQMHQALTQKHLAPDALSDAALAGEPEAVATVSLAVQLLGRLLGDLALSFLPFGGLYLVGGVARSLAPHFEPHGLIAAMHDKGRFSAYTAQFPVHLVIDDYAALAGCAAHLAELD